eukprot:Seg2533.5 transcript_id=Seg2533.5/GoldUCD/mRNA.D3Y31 product="putative protein C16orf52 A" protein_id=Seg2533.5/GoldUCD/D3Y31
MDKLAAVTTSLFMGADAMAIISLLKPEWIVTNFAGTTKFGLTQSCIQFKGQKEICTRPHLPSEWATTLVFIVIGTMLIFGAGLLIIMSMWKDYLLKVSRWLSFFGVILFCLSALIFPFGFDIPEIGGEAYKLPPNTEVGMSYYLFFTSLFFSAMACALANLYALHFNIPRA